ncbi:MAG: TonB-dependent receptor [Crocinitomicaceae bacterium]|nr:TonB-dependent receptor [Crocinitomicaceae bacterium]
MIRSLRIIFLLACIVLGFTLSSVKAQSTLVGLVSCEGEPVSYATITIPNSRIGIAADDEGKFKFENLPAGQYKVVASSIGFISITKEVTMPSSGKLVLNFSLEKNVAHIHEVVVSGTMKEVSKLESAVPVEVYSPKFFNANPTPSVCEAIQLVNGVRPQINCSVCNTGDIHINGLEGPYTMVLIDGMPIVSGLSTVYGLNGIPTSLIERIEVVKGPASTLYGSEAVGGLINIITKKTTNAPIFSADIFGTGWGEVNIDLATKFSVNKNIESFIGVNQFTFDQRIDNDGDNFTDMALQDRISVFNKWNFIRKYNRFFTLAARYVNENRFGGDMDWDEDLHRGGDEVYGESIYTDRWEVFGTYQLPFKELVMFQFSANGHHQNSVYGDTEFIANQRVGFGQLVWDKQLLDKHSLLAGLTMRYNYYDDNTPATASTDTINPSNLPTHTYLPGIFVQDEITLNDNSKILLGIRYDHNSLHGDIFTPRVNYKWSSMNNLNTIRVSLGTGYRVANIFTEDHAALNGTREVIIASELNPERSINGNLNYVRNIYTRNNALLNIDASVFYTHFDNKIIPDYDTNPNQIIYDNIDGKGISQGISINLDVINGAFKLRTGATLMSVFTVEDYLRERQELTEKFSGTWSIGYRYEKAKLEVNYTGNIYSPMELPTMSDGDFIDPRPAQSPWYSIQNVQVTKNLSNSLECFGGVKNILDWTPWKNMPDGVFYLGNTLDPFEQNTLDGQLVFDPTYVYAPNQGIRGFLGIRYNMR